MLLTQCCKFSKLQRNITGKIRVKKDKLRLCQRQAREFFVLNEAVNPTQSTKYCSSNNSIPHLYTGQWHDLIGGKLSVILSAVFFPADPKMQLNSQSPCWDFLSLWPLFTRHSWHFYSASIPTPVAKPSCNLPVSTVTVFCCAAVNESIFAISTGAVKYLITGKTGAYELRKLDTQPG